MPSNNNCNNIQNRCHDNRRHFRHNKNVILVGAWTPIRAPVPDSRPGACPTKYRIDQIRSNSNFAWNSYRCAFEDNRPIITKFGTRHDSRTVVTYTKFRYDRPTIIEIRGTRIFSKFWIRSNLSIRYLVGQAPGHLAGRRQGVRLIELFSYYLK